MYFRGKAVRTLSRKFPKRIYNKVYKTEEVKLTKGKMKKTGRKVPRPDRPMKKVLRRHYDLKAETVKRCLSKKLLRHIDI